MGRTNRRIRGGRRAPLKLGAMVAAGGVLAVTVASALAGTPSEVSHSTAVPENGQVTVDAKCPHGEAPVSGGFSLSDGSLMLNSSEGVDLSKKRWELVSGSFGGDGRSTAFAYCSRLGRNLKFRSERTTLQSADSATVTANCHKDERVLSGGYAYVSSGAPMGSDTKSVRNGSHGWTVHAINIAPQSTTFLVFAHCQRKQKVPAMKTVRESVPFTSGGGPTTATAKCPRGRYALSGGFRFPDRLQFFTAQESRRKGSNAWTATTGSSAGSQDKFTAFAYCAKR